jgi:chromosome partitioning protein
MPPKTRAPTTLTIAVLNQKGGVGKTTLSVNIAAVAHLEGRRVLILDLDAQGSAIDWSAAREPGSKLDGLAVSRADRALTLPRFRELTSAYDVAVLDGPPRVGSVSQAAAVAADVVVVPLRPGAYDWWACSETLTLLNDADEARAVLGRDPVRRVFVLNAVNRRTRTAQAAIEAVEGIAGAPPIVVGLRDAFAATAATGESVFAADPNGPAAEEMRVLWRALNGGK